MNQKSLRVALFTAAVVICGLVIFSLLRSPDQKRVWHQEAGYRWAKLHVDGGDQPRFALVRSGQTGITFENDLTDKQIKNNRVLLNGSGVALGDVDGDGWVDIYFCKLNGPNVLYRNLGNWRFEDITDSAGVACPDQFSTGTAFADIDGDDDLDLLVFALGGPNKCFLNDGAGRFTQVTEERGLGGETGATTLALADIEGDGDLDLYVTNYKTLRTQDLYTPLELTFDNIVQKKGDTYQIAPRLQDHYTLQIKGTRILWFEKGEPDLLYLNDGNGTFRRERLTDGRFLDEGGQPVADAYDWGLTARFHDLNGDGAPDLYVCNDFESPDRIWINDGGRFRAIPSLAVRNTSNSSMAVDFSDINRDGHVDLFVADMLSRVHEMRKTQRTTMVPLPLDIGEIKNRPQYMKNTLFLNRGDDTYAEIGQYSRVNASEWSWSVLFMDADLDGFEDLLISTGQFYDSQDMDTREQIISRAMSGMIGNLRDVIFMYPKLELPNVAFRNSGNLIFEDASDRWGFNATDISHGMAFGDLDHDGDLDVVINRFRQEAAVYENRSAEPRIAVRLRGQPPNTRAIGAKITLTGGAVPQTKEVTAGGAYVSHSEPLHAFAANSEAESLTLKVTWRDGGQTRIDGVQPNRIYEIHEPEVKASTPPDSPSREPKPYFEDVSHLIAHRHIEEPYDDFRRQPLLPRKLSQLGPGVAWFDVDGDGDDDLLIGSGRGGHLAAYRNQSSDGFERLARAPWNRPTEHDQTAILGLAGPDGARSLLVGHTNYERQDAGDSFVLAYDLIGGQINKIRTGETGLGPLALADVDGDGDLDLFAGGRVVPGRYPEPPASRLLRNEAGEFVPATDQDALFKNLGLVSGATFSDLDGDGDPDLILAVEWDSPRMLLNEDGHFSDATETLGLADYRGWWNGVATGDFNEDGRPDILVTNWGQNHKYRMYDHHPLRLYYADFNNNGVLDVIEAYFDPGLNAIVPERNLSDLAQSLPYVRIRTNTHRKFATATLAQIMGSQLQKAGELQANTLRHMVFINRGERFEAQPLPPEAQFAPAFFSGVADFDGDGHEDIFLSQNFFASHLETPRCDAGRGLWLKGDSSGQFIPVPGHRSGVRVYGEQRGAALGDYDRDGRVDLVVTQNGAATHLYRNVRGEPGLRVRLIGPRENPLAIGARLRLVYDENRGPVREIQAGSGYWSQNSAVQVLGQKQRPTRIWVRWPDGQTATYEVPAGSREITIHHDGGTEVKTD